jgi:phospholipid/cholesterol/gamma-HCH transport system permease protein
MKVLEDVGRSTLGLLEYAGGLAGLSADSSSFIARMRIRAAETFTQAYFLGVQSTSIVLLTSLFTGMVISLESAVQAVQFGVGDLVGGGVAFISSRELGPLLTGVVVAGRTGAAIAAELGSMVVTEQVEALEALGLAPVQMLVVPRLIALAIMMPILTVFADIISVVGGMWLANNVAHISYQTFIQSARQTVGLEDVLKGLFKAFVFGVIIALVGSYQGLNTRGGAAGVGKATTGAVVVSIILIFVANFTLSFLMFGYSG